MFRTHRWVRVPRIIPAEPGRQVNDDNNMDVDREIEVPLPMLIRERLVPVGVLGIINNEPGLNGVRQMPRGMPFVADQLLALPPAVPARPLIRNNGLRVLPRAMVRRLEAMNDGNHTLALKFLREKYLREAAERGTMHSLM